MSEEERARFEVLLEDIKGTVGFIAEGHVSLNAKMDSLSSKVDRIEADVSILKTDVSILKTDVSILKTDVRKLDQRVHRIEDHLGLNGVTKGGRSTRRPKAKSPTKKR